MTIKNYQNYLVKDLQNQCIETNIKQNVNRNMTHEYRYFLKSNLVVVNRLFVLIYLNRENEAKRFKAQRYYLPKSNIKNDNVVINGKNVYDQ